MSRKLQSVFLGVVVIWTFSVRSRSRMEAVRDTPVTAGIAGAVALNWLLALAVKGATSTVGLVVANTTGTRFFIWNLLTSSFHETSLPRAALAGLCCAAAAALRLERRFGPWFLFAFYVAFVALACGVATSVLLFACYVVTREEEYLFTETYGAGGLVAALAVAAKRWHGGARLHNALPEALTCVTFVALRGGGSALGVRAPGFARGSSPHYCRRRRTRRANRRVPRVPRRPRFYEGAARFLSSRPEPNARARVDRR